MARPTESLILRAALATRTHIDDLLDNQAINSNNQPPSKNMYNMLPTTMDEICFLIPTEPSSTFLKLNIKK